MKLKTPLCFRDRFEFVIDIDVSTETAPQTATGCRAEIYDRCQLVAVLQLRENVARLEIAEIALRRCIAFAEARIRQTG